MTDLDKNLAKINVLIAKRKQIQDKINELAEKTGLWAILFNNNTRLGIDYPVYFVGLTKEDCLKALSEKTSFKMVNECQITEDGIERPSYPVLGMIEYVMPNDVHGRWDRVYRFFKEGRESLWLN